MNLFVAFLLAAFVVASVTADRAGPPRRALRLAVCVLVALAFTSFRVVI